MSNDLFERRSSPPDPGKQPYLAYGLVKPCKRLVRLNIHRADSSIQALDDANLMDVISADPQFCTLFYDKCMVQLEGYRLDDLVELLKYYDIRFAECFDPQKHRTPAEDAPLIEFIQCKAVFEDDNRFVLSKGYQTGIPFVSME